MTLSSRLALLAAVLLGTASEAAHAQVELGVRIGANASSVTAGDALALSGRPRSGVVAGGTAALHLSPTLSVQIEALYSQKGRVLSQSSSGDTVTLGVDHLEIPATLGVALPVVPTLEVRLRGGGAVGVPLVSRVSGGPQELQAGVDASAVVALAVSRGRFAVDARYTHGFGTVAATPPGGGDPEVEGSLRTVSLSLGVGLAGGR